MLEVVFYDDGSKNIPYDRFLNSIKDASYRARIGQRIGRIQSGNFGDHAPIKGVGISNLWELRFTFGAGYRVYYGIFKKDTVVILTEGDKSKQKKKDIPLAVELWKDYLETNK